MKLVQLVRVSPSFRLWEVSLKFPQIVTARVRKIPTKNDCEQIMDDTEVTFRSNVASTVFMFRRFDILQVKKVGFTLYHPWVNAW